MSERRAVIVGSGPNGFAAAITLAQAGLEVTLLEAADEVGGGVRSAELTLPGVVHDVCSAIYPFGRISPFFAAQRMALEASGLRWIRSPAAFGHPLDEGPPVMLRGGVDETAAGLGRDGDAYRRLLSPLVVHWDELDERLLAPFNVPLNPFTALRMARFGWHAIQSARRVARRFRDERARALFAGAAAHAILPLHEQLSAAAALMMLATAHRDGWPIVAGGAGNLSRALAARLTSLGGRIETGVTVTHLDQLAEHDVALFDVMPRALAQIAGERLGDAYRRRLERYRHGPGVFKLDLCIDGPIPWRDEELLEAGTVHLGGTLEEIARAEAQVHAGQTPDRPFVLLAQQSLFDADRAPAGRHTVWAYCHVPNGASADMSEPIVDQIERFAPGVRERVLALTATTPADLERHNANNVGGDIAGGRFDLGQLFTRPAGPFEPYATPDARLFLCSAATPPGAGVHGMAGYHAAQSVLRRVRSV